MNSHHTVLLMTCAVAAAAAWAAPPDEAPAALARRAGCMLCHESSPRVLPDGTKRYLAPSWELIAGRYRNDARAEERLTNTVLSGTGPLIADQHWRGKVFFSEMPPNDVQISPSDARTLVRWILAH